VTIRFWLAIMLVVALAAAAVIIIPRLEGDPPEIAEVAAIELGRTPRPLVVDVSDESSGLKSVEVRLLTSGEPKTLAERHFPGDLIRGGEAHSESIELTLDPAALGLPDGTATLVVVARDWSLRDGFTGNSNERSIPLQIDTTPPRLSVESGLTYIYRGGSGAVVYSVGEDTASDGVRVGSSFFAGHPLPGARGNPGNARERVAIFAIPVEEPPDAPVIVVARDSAGNESTGTFPIRIFDRQFSENSITLSDRFLSQTVRPLAEATGLAGGDLGHSFKQVNEQLRARNEERIRAIVESSSSDQRWQGSFEQMRNSKVTSRFAERRTYVWGNEPISKAVHYGFDLASTAGAPVAAANTGVVVLADDLGIYGNCVLVDHGLGVHSLYAHMSQIDVAVGSTVSKGETLGKSGSTGLAGGDHLHFAILVGGRYVDPLEWWDPKWVRSHIEWRIQPTLKTAQGG
jgi:murein DD-endopeptidase MepM/ murein hydrolase activator NlpD